MSNITLAEKEFEPLAQWDGLKAKFSDSSLSSFVFSDESSSINLCPTGSAASEAEELKESIIEDKEIVVKGPVEYMEEVLLPQLKPKMISVLQEAIEKELFDNGRSFLFNATNCLSLIMLNIDPLYPKQSFSDLLETTLGRMCQQPVRERRGRGAKYSYAADQMSKDTAVRIIQRQIRGWIVRKQPHVQEMRQFWKALKRDKNLNDGPLNDGASSTSSLRKSKLKNKRKISKC